MRRGLIKKPHNLVSTFSHWSKFNLLHIAPAVSPHICGCCLCVYCAFKIPCLISGNSAHGRVHRFLYKWKNHFFKMNGIQALLDAPKRNKQGVVTQQRYVQSYVTPSLYLCLMLFSWFYLQRYRDDVASCIFAVNNPLFVPFCSSTHPSPFIWRNDSACFHYFPHS